MASKFVHVQGYAVPSGHAIQSEWVCLPSRQNKFGARGAYQPLMLASLKSLPAIILTFKGRLLYMSVSFHMHDIYDMEQSKNGSPAAYNGDNTVQVRIGYKVGGCSNIPSITIKRRKFKIKTSHYKPKFIGCSNDGP